MNPSRATVLKGLGTVVRKRRLALGWSQELLAQYANLDRTYISGVERGVRNPSLTALTSLANGFGITVSALLEGIEEEASPNSGKD